MHRRYNIEIKISAGAAHKAENVLVVFGCSVSEPSNWVAYGSTKERGLTFLDETGKELDSSVFQHQAVFNLLNDKKSSEEQEVRALVYALLWQHYNIDQHDVTVVVNEYNRL